tara:strand:- start:64 stop:552 length:489 start_codon:yes stop_codon:yes gene_type:complete
MSEIYDRISKKLKSENLTIVNSDLNRPWGGFFLIDEKGLENFANIYFSGLKIDEIKGSVKLSPKILIIAPNKRLSWQYHQRRSELWKVASNSIRVITSHDDIERKETLLKKGDKIEISQGERHRIIGTQDYAVVAEIWIHTDKDNPSDENDIVRIQDDFDRN